MERRKETEGETEKIIPFVLLPEVAGEGDEQYCSENTQSCTEPYPELHTLAWQRFLFRQRHTSHTQLRLSPHIQKVLRMNTHIYIE